MKAGVAEGGGWLRRIEVSWVKDRIVAEARQATRDGLVHLLGISAWQIGPAATLEEQRVARHQPPRNAEALTAGSVARRVHELDLEVAHLDHVCARMLDELRFSDSGLARDPSRLVALHVHGDARVLEQVGDALDRVSHHPASDVVGMGMRDEHARKPHAVCCEQVEQTSDVVRRVDDDGLSCRPVADQVAEVDHLAGERVLVAEIAAREELAEVEPFFVVLSVCHGSDETIRKENGPSREPTAGLRSVMAIERDEVATFAPLVHRPDTTRLEELYASAQRRLVIQIAALTGDVAEAEDLVQEAFGRCLARWAQVAGYDDPEAWVRSVAYNLARSRWRRLKRGAKALARIRRDDAQPEPDIENVGLLIAVSKLAEDERVAIVHHYLLDQPISVVALQLRIPEGTVKSRLARGRAELAEMLGPAAKEDRHG